MRRTTGSILPDTDVIGIAPNLFWKMVPGIAGRVLICVNIIRASAIRAASSERPSPRS
jgi:hypothetical protein